MDMSDRTLVSISSTYIYESCSYSLLPSLPLPPSPPLPSPPTSVISPHSCSMVCRSERELDLRRSLPTSLLLLLSFSPPSDGRLNTTSAAKVGGLSEEPFGTAASVESRDGRLPELDQINGHFIGYVTEQ